MESLDKRTSVEIELDYEDAEEFAGKLDRCASVFLEEGQEGTVQLTRGMHKVVVKGSYGASSWKAETTAGSDAIRYLKDENYIETDNIISRLTR